MEQPEHVDNAHLSPLARIVAEAIGNDGLQALMRAFPGQEVNIPESPDASQKLNAVLTPAQRAALLELFKYRPERRFYVPGAYRNLAKDRAAKVRELRAAGLSAAEVARQVGLSRRRVVTLSKDPVR